MANVSDDLELVSRLACFGSENGTFNVLKKTEFSVEETESIKSVLALNRGPEVVKRLKTIANQKCYVKRESILFSLASIIENISSQENNHKNDVLRKEVYGIVRDLCETPSDLFTFVNFDKQVRSTSKASWGRGMRSLITNWYVSKSPHELAQQTTQCKSAYGYSHKDLIVQTHLKCDRKSKGTGLVLNYLLKGRSALEKTSDAAADDDDGDDVKKAVSILESVEKLKKSQESEREIIRTLIETNCLLDKQIPLHFFKLRETFEGLIGHMSLVSLVKSIPKMAEMGILDPMSPDAQRVIDRIKDAESFKKERVSPVAVLVAMRKYDINRLKRWIRNPRMAQSLHSAYNYALENVINTGGKRCLLAVHVDSKLIKTCVTGSASTLTPIMPCTVFAQMLARVENNPTFVYFTSALTKELKLSKTPATVAIVEQLVQAAKEPTNEVYDICDPLRWAINEKKAFDCVLIISVKKQVSSHADLKATIASYRTECDVPNAKVAIIGLSDSMPFPNREDLNFLDVAGFDEDVPDLVQQFFKGLPQE